MRFGGIKNGSAYLYDSRLMLSKDFVEHMQYSSDRLLPASEFCRPYRRWIVPVFRRTVERFGKQFFNRADSVFGNAVRPAVQYNPVERKEQGDIARGSADSGCTAFLSPLP